MGRFPESKEIIDRIVFLVALYGFDSFVLAKAQNRAKEYYKDVFTKKFKFRQEHPLPMPEDVQPATSPKKKEKGEEDKLVCTHYGCGKPYSRDKNKRKECVYHPGKFEFGSIRGYWPEGWSCCMQPWDSSGCTKGYHSGVPEDKQVFLCINHGEQNKETKYPDSFCGRPFSKKNSDGCRYHSGYIVGKTPNKKWTCCQGSANKDGECEPCTTGSHKYATYPDEEAKLYFFDLPIQNPGLERKQESMMLLFSKYGKFSGFFRETKKYKEATLHKISNEEKEKLDKEDRICLNWACNQVYKQIDNNGKACRFHPGRWDFGYTGNSIKDLSMSNLSTLATPLWLPHWTCCRKGWTDKGCKKYFHRGPLVKEYDPNIRKYKWPDERAQIYFAKRVSESWVKKIDDSGVLNQEKVEKLFDYFLKKNEGAIPVQKLTVILEKLKFPMLVSSPDLSFQFKYKDITEGRAFTLLDDGKGNVDKSKFMKWWFCQVEEIANDRFKAAEQK